MRSLESVRNSPGTINITCEPGFTPACDDILRAFLAANWREGTYQRTGPYYGGFDQIFPYPNAEITLYFSPEADAVAIAVTKALRYAGISVTLRADNGQEHTTALGFEVMYFK